MPRVINNRALTGEKTSINKAIHKLLMHDYATFSMPVKTADVTRSVLPGPRISIVRGNCVCETSAKR